MRRWRSRAPSCADRPRTIGSRCGVEAFTVSEHAYALLGAATAFRAFGEAADRALAERAANLILSKLDPETGNIPAEHYEAPKGTHLVDTVYTVNWSFLALQMAAKLTGDARIAAAKEKKKSHKTMALLFCCLMPTPG